MSASQGIERTNEWLEEVLATTWYRHFSDVPQTNEVVIRFGRRAKTRLGSIVLKNGVTYITINRLLALPVVPEEITTATIAHELVHYAHGFGSALPRKYHHPHAGGVVTKEYAHRNLIKLHQYQQRWLKKNWQSLIREQMPVKQRKKAYRVSRLFWSG